MLKKLLIILIAASIFSCSDIKNSNQVHTVAFYNLENLFDTKNDSLTLDEMSPIMEIEVNREEVYQQKLDNMAKVISELGKSKTGTAPTLIGVCEIENHFVLDDLLNTSHLINESYDYIHYDSPDLRGIDVALFYKTNWFSPKHHETFELKLWDEEEQRIFTRDQLLVTGYLDGELIHLIVNHWPSRRGGPEQSSYKREKAAALNVQIIEKLRKENPDAKIITMGDLNDDPTDKSLKSVLLSSEETSNNNLYNPMESLFENGGHTLVYRDQLNLFDQIIFTQSFLDTEQDGFQLDEAYVYKPSYLTNQEGKYKGYPYRSFAGGKFLGGYSDHYPVYAYLKRKGN